MIYNIAGLRIKIENQYSFTDNFCKAYLSEDQSSPADIIAAVSEEEFAEEKEKSEGFSDGYIENICLYRSICLQLPKFNRMLLHAAILECDGSGYAFLGKSGTGKSTHTRLWLQYLPQSFIVNGDKPILEFTNQGVFAYGTPWMGKERFGKNTKTELKGLCFLEQAKENSIEKLSVTKIAARLFIQILLPTEEKAATRTLELADELVMRVPAYLLKCDISENAVATSYEALTGKTYKI